MLLSCKLFSIHRSYVLSVVYLHKEFYFVYLISKFAIARVPLPSKESEQLKAGFENKTYTPKILRLFGCLVLARHPSAKLSF